MSLLTLSQAACDLIGVPRPTSIVAGADQTARTLLSCAQREGRTLARRWAWSALTKDKVFTSAATSAQPAALPTDFGRMVADTFYNRSLHRPVQGPLTAQEWDGHVALSAAVLFDAFRIRQGQVELLPTPAAGLTYAFTYVSADWCRDETSTVTRSLWAADADAGLLDEELMTLGVIWRFKQSRGLDYAEDMRTYEIEVAQAMARDGARRTVDLGGDATGSMPRLPGVAEGSWAL